MKRRLATSICFVALSMTVGLRASAQSINVTTPRLPPRADSPAATTSPSAQQPTAPSPTGQTAAQQPHAQPQAPQPHAPQPHATQAYPAQSPTYAAPAPVVVPQRAPAGHCRVQPTPDRQTLMLVSGADALARTQLPLGEYRAQQVIHSPDARWAVAYTKLRGAAQYAALTIDLERCEAGRTIELSAAGDDVRFEADEAVLVVGGKERRIGLRDARVR